MRNWTAMGLALVLATGVGTAAAATPKPRPPSEAQVRQLMEVFGVSRMLNQTNTQMAAMMQQQLPCVPASYWQGFIDTHGVHELTERMVPIYQRHFSASDIQGLIRFYRSPLGRKVIREMPATLSEGMQLSQEWGRGRAQAMLVQLQKSGQVDAQGRCPATPTTPGAKLVAPAAGSSSAGH